MRNNVLFASALAVCLVACGNRDFNKPALLDKPRILAVQAEPPQPSFGVSTTLSTVLYQPPSDHPAGQCASPGATTYKWSWCPWPMSSNTKFECPISQPEFDQLFAGLGLGTAPSLDLGTTETATFTNPFPAQILYALCRGDIGSSLGGPTTGGSADGGAGRSIFGCDLPAKDYNTSLSSQTDPIGFKVTIKVEITPACPSLLPDGFSPLVAIYSLHLPTDDTIPVNNNPVISGISATAYGTGPDGGDVLDGGATAAAGTNAPDGGIPLDDQASVTVARDKHVGLALALLIGTAEHLAVPSTIDYDSTHKLTRHYEHLDIAWYAEAGDFSGSGKGDNTGYLPTAYPDGEDEAPLPTDEQNFEFNTTNTWDLPRSEDYAPATARIIVVVRDGRGGVGWTSRVVHLGDNP